MNKSSYYLLLTAGVFALLSVVLGAFAAHGLKSFASGYLISVFNTGVQYQMWHALAIIACALLIQNTDDKKMQKGLSSAALCFIIGIFCFSGSLYALALTGIKWFGPVTPLGGMAFILGWGLFLYTLIKSR